MAKKEWSGSQREAYVKAFRNAQRTPEGSPDALYGGTVRDKAGKEAARKVVKKKR